jgi:hypothetical protein
VLVDARRPESTGARSDGHLALLEVGEERVLFLVGRGAVLLAWAGGAAAGDEPLVRLDRLVGVDGLWRRRDRNYLNASAARFGLS